MTSVVKHSCIRPIFLSSQNSVRLLYCAICRCKINSNQNRVTYTFDIFSYKSNFHVSRLSARFLSNSIDYSPRKIKHMRKHALLTYIVLNSNKKNIHWACISLQSEGSQFKTNTEPLICITFFMYLFTTKFYNNGALYVIVHIYRNYYSNREENIYLTTIS